MNQKIIKINFIIIKAMSLEEKILRKKIKKSKSSLDNNLVKQKKVVIEYEDDEDSKIVNENFEEIPKIPFQTKQKKNKKTNKLIKEESLLPENSNKYKSLSICFPDSIIALHQVNSCFRKI